VIAQGESMTQRISFETQALNWHRQGSGLMQWGKGFPLMRWLLLSIFLFLGCRVEAAVPPQSTDEIIQIGVLAYEGKADAIHRWAPTAAYLNEKNPGYDFRIEPMFLSELVAAVRENRLDFVLTQPLQFVQLAQTNDVWPLATMVVRTPGGRLDRFGSAIIVRADDQDIRHISDLKNRIVAGASNNALGAWLLGLDTLARVGIDPETQIRPLFTGLPMFQVVQAVEQHRADAGVIRAGFLEQIVAQGVIKPGEFRVLDPKLYSGYPYQVSTELVPEWPFSSTKKVDRAFAAKVARELMSMTSENPAMIAAGIEKWTLPLDYSTVQQIRDRWLPIDPSLVALLKRYGWWLLLPVALILLIFFIQGRRTQEKVARQETQLRKTLNALKDAVVVFSMEGRVLFANQPSRDLLMHPVVHLDELQGRHFTLLFDMRWREVNPDFDLRSAIGQLCQLPEQSYSVQLSVGHQLRDIDVHLRLLGSCEEKLSSKIILTLRDVTDYREATALLAYRATHDRLTGLLNHTAFIDFLEGQCHSLGEKKCEGLILWLDVDDFRLINETNSRTVGDQVVARIASCLSLSVPPSGVIARLGVDEFGIWIPDVNAFAYQQWPDELLNGLQNMRFEVGDKRLRVSISMGACLVDYRLGAGLLNDAEAACRRAHREGGNRVVWFSRDDQEIVSRRHQLATLHQLKQALDEGELRQVVQAIAPLPLPAANRPHVPHYEVLLRLRGADGKLQSPVQFIEAAEKYHFMTEIDRWVVRQTFALLASCENERPLLAINLSGATVQDPAMNAFIRAAFREFDLDPALICFEITETSAITNYELVLELVHSLRQMGCKISLDDFGAGLLSFEFMRRLRPDFVKIDGKLVRDIEHDPVASVIVTAIQRVSEVMGAKTIGEWVENEATLLRLDTIGVDFIQGYYYHAPVPIETLFPRACSHY
jgi:diguanylate cyclase (GGDEF)-like protein